MSINYSFGKWNFKTQKELDITIKHLFQNSPKNIEFENEFFTELINKYHRGVTRAGIKVTKFKILTFDNQMGKWEYAQKKFRGGKLMTGYFEPLGEWHGVTVYPHKKNSPYIKTKLIKILREKWAESAEVRKDNQLCEECKIMPCPQLHHNNISFKEIGEKCLSFFTEDELINGVSSDWWKQECESDSISSKHPAVVEMLRLHKNVKYKWLCSDCHKKQHKKMRAKK